MQVAVRVTSRLTQSCSRQLTTFSDYLASNFVRKGKKSIERMELVEAVRYYREAIEGGGGGGKRSKIHMYKFELTKSLTQINIAKDMMCYFKGFYFGSHATFRFRHVSNKNHKFQLKSERLCTTGSPKFQNIK